MEHGKAKFYLGIYQLIGWLSFFTILPLFLLYSAVTGRHRQGLLQRLGFFRNEFPPGTRRFWIHAASIGEAQAAHKLLMALRTRYPVATYLITTVTEQGRRLAQDLSGDYAMVALAPLDFPLSAYLAVEKVRPTAYICMETELWPNTLYFLQHFGAKLFITNGRISERSFRKYRFILPLTRFVLGFFSSISVIGPEEAKRFADLGAEENQLQVTGNIKFDLDTAAETNSPLEEMRNLLGIACKATVFVCGSTRGDEEALLLTAYKKIKEQLPDLIWIVAPRHMERLREVEVIFNKESIGFQRLTSCRAEGRKTDVILVDTLGELRLLYGLGTYIFCGGSLVPKGGHNIMEAAIWGRPVFFGPHMDDFKDAKDLLEEAGAGITIHSTGELSRKIIELHENPQNYESICRRTLATATRNQGVAQKQSEIIACFL